MKQRIACLGLMLASAGCSAQPQPDAPLPEGLPFRVTQLARFDRPFALAFLPDGRALITEKPGRLKLWQANGPTIDVTGVPDVAAVDQGGLLDVAPAPGFARDRRIYLSYAEPSVAGSALALARARLVETDGTARLDRLEVIWRQSPPGRGGQFGAIIAFAPDGRSLFLASGERKRFTPAQDPDQALGKILHLTLDGQPAPGNPGAGKAGAAFVMVTDPPRDTEAAKTAPARRMPVAQPNETPAETWSSGHRNPYGLAFAPDGRLWEHEMGPKGGDELNLILPGRNYGWPNASNGDNYDDVPIPDHRPGDGYEPPRLWWNPSISPSGLIFYTGGLFPQWKGSAFLGALSGKALIRVRIDGDRAARADQWPMGTRIRDVAQGPDGAIWLLEDGGRGGGRLLRLTPR